MPATPRHFDDMSRYSDDFAHGHKHNLRNRFEVLKTLGQGTYGKVKLAIDKLSGTEVAIKYIKKTKIQSENDLIRIRREIDIMSHLNHPHIIKVHEVFENKEKIILVMEYACGGELYDYINERQGLDEEEARICFRQIVSAVNYLHQNGIVHRDLKLENIVLDQYGDVKIADFGLSNLFSKDAMLQTFCGSPLYASPEIINGLPYCGPEVDCWSLGVLLYAIVYGAMPFDGSDFKRLRNQITMGQYFEPENPSECAGLLKKILTVQAARRAGITEICKHWWVNRGFKYTPQNTDKLSETTDIDDNVIDSDNELAHEDLILTASGSESETETEFRVVSEPVPTPKRKGILKNATPERSQQEDLVGASASPEREEVQREFGRHHRESGIESGASGEELDHDSLEESDEEIDPIIDMPSNRGAHIIDTPGNRDAHSSVEVSNNHNNDTDTVNTGHSTPASNAIPVPNAVFDSSKKPVRGILKNKNLQKYQGSDSGCVIVSMPDSSSNNDSGLQREPSLENSYDLTDIEQVLDDIDAKDTSTRRTSLQYIEQYQSLGKYVQYTSMTSPACSATADGSTGQTAPPSGSTGNTVVKRRKGILKKHGKYSSDYDPTKRYSYGSQGSNSSADILDFSYDSLDEDTPRRAAREVEELSSSIPEDAYLYQERGVTFGADFKTDFLNAYCHDNYRDQDDEIIQKIKDLGEDDFAYNDSLVTDDTDLFNVEEARLVYEQAVRYCSDST